MKKIVLSLLTLTVFISCKKEKEPEIVPTEEEKEVAVIPVQECYEGILKNDTISMAITVADDQSVTGKLNYKFFEKDKNEGTLTGQMKGDTLFGDYTFMSEGMTSVREVVFLKKGKLFTEGYGDVVDDNKGKITFKDKKKLFFDSKVVLVETECK